MTVQATYINGISGYQYDRYLESGWFRGSGMMYRSEFICANGSLYSIINIRFSLSAIELSKSMRKIMRTNNERYRVCVGMPEMNEEKELMYTDHKERFKAFLYPSLEEILFGNSEQERMEMREIAVYDGDKLIALSYFDIGQKTIASIIGLFDQSYSKQSLGFYSMLKEMEWAVENGKQWYYPGYVMDIPSEFDYKLRLGKAQWMSSPGTWEDWKTFKSGVSQAAIVRDKVALLARFLESRGVSSKAKLYPYFTMGHIVQTKDALLKYPIFLDVREGTHRYAAIYDLENNNYLMIQVVEIHKYDAFLDLDMSKEYKSNPEYELGILKIQSSSPIFLTDESFKDQHSESVI